MAAKTSTLVQSKAPTAQTRNTAAMAATSASSKAAKRPLKAVGFDVCCPGERVEIIGAREALPADAVGEAAHVVAEFDAVVEPDGDKSQEGQ